MDARDAEILAVLGKNCRLPLRTIAERLGISVAAVQKRLSLLEETGVIHELGRRADDLKALRCGAP